ncbi:MAG TPA: hypothetical protein VL551_12435 [Actinospica sp.]|nr:hypothetical protein [Actinospica sp.]
MSKFGLFWCFVAGLGFAAFVVGFPVSFSGDGAGGAFIALGVNVWWLTALLGYGLLAARAGRIRQRVLAGSEVMRTALAKVETAQATGEAPRFSVRMGLTVAPDGAPAFRVDTITGVNVMDVDAYRAGRLLVVTYDETRPWRVTVVTRPTPEWAQRVTHGAVDSAPMETRIEEPRTVLKSRRRWARAGTMAMLLGIAVGLAYFISTHGW